MTVREPDDPEEVRDTDEQFAARKAERDRAIWNPPERCSRCRFAVLSERDEAATYPSNYWYECRRYPPALALADEGPWEGEPTLSQFPVLSATDWCGEFKAAAAVLE